MASLECYGQQPSKVNRVGSSPLADRPIMPRYATGACPQAGYSGAVHDQPRPAEALALRSARRVNRMIGPGSGSSLEIPSSGQFPPHRWGQYFHSIYHATHPPPKNTGTKKNDHYKKCRRETRYFLGRCRGLPLGLRVAGPEGGAALLASCARWMRETPRKIRRKCVSNPLPFSRAGNPSANYFSFSCGLSLTTLRRCDNCLSRIKAALPDVQRT